MHVTTCASERNWSLWGATYTKARNRLAIERAEKLIFIRGNYNHSSYNQPDEEVMMKLLAGDDGGGDD